MKHKLRSFSICIFSILTTLAFFTLPISAQSSPFDDVDAWKNEGVFNPLTPFTSYDWPQESKDTFSTEFAAWSKAMDQSYYKMGKDLPATFNDFSFEELIDIVDFDGYRIGFTDQNEDYRSDWDSFRVDIFAVYASDIPVGKHLYIFGIDQDDHPIVLYLDGEQVKNGNIDLLETQNQELKKLFFDLYSKETGIVYATQPTYLTLDEFFTLPQHEQFQYCSTTPWYEIPDGMCSNKGLMPDAHYEAALEYGRTYRVSREEAYDATYKASYYENPTYNSVSPGYHKTNYDYYLESPDSYTQIGGQKVPITVVNSDLNGDALLDDEELEIARNRHNY